MTILLVILIILPTLVCVAYGWEPTVIFWLCAFGGSLILKLAGLGF